MAKPKHNYKALADQLFELFKEGRSVVEVCQVLGISRKSYYQWKREKTYFRDKAEFAEEAAEAWYLRQGRVAMFGKFPGFDTGIYCFTMKTRFKHRENDDLDRNKEQEAPPLNITFKVAPPRGEIEVTHGSED
jgi:transposase